jgi:hypothetical protein
MKLTSNWVKNRWESARQQKAFYKENFDKDISVREFYKKPENNPLFQKIVRYDVTFGFNAQFMKNNVLSYSFSIPQNTFIVYSIRRDNEIENTILNRTKEAVSLKFQGNSVNWIFNKLDDNENVRLRGVEVKEIDYNEISLSRLQNEITYIKDNPDFNVVKKTKTKTNTSKYNLDIWLK